MFDTEPLFSISNILLLVVTEQQQHQADEKSPLPSADRLSVSFIMGERDGSSLGTSSVRMDSPVGGGGHVSNHQQQHYLDIGILTYSIILDNIYV